ncbi:MAG: TetR/AcrR family transcriptional regulator [Promethearchaeota archaeon]
MEKKISKKDKIINAALKIITKKGNMDFTIRDVVLDADVNIASVNYYFGTKKKLIQEIEEKFIQTLFKYNLILKNPKIPPKQRLFKWAYTIIEDLINNPGIVSILSNKLILTEQFDEKIESFMHEHTNYLSVIIKEITGIEDEEQIKLRIIRFDADLFFPMLFSSNSKKIFGFSIYDPKIRTKYVESVINSIL